MPLQSIVKGAVDRIYAAVGASAAKRIARLDVRRRHVRYECVMMRRHAKTKILGMATPVPIANLYIDVLVYTQPPSRLFSRTGRMVDPPTAMRSHAAETEPERMPAEEQIVGKERLVILGLDQACFLRFSRVALDKVLETPLFLAYMELWNEHHSYARRHFE